MNGYHGKILTVDLTVQSWAIETLSPDVYRKRLGGKGLGTYLMLERIPVGVDPLSPDNGLIFATGPLADTGIHGSNRYGVYSKSPQTGFYSESYSGGNVTPAMKRTGYDAILIQGRAGRPAFLEISDTGVIFHDAGDLWGKETYETQDAVLARVSRPDAQAVVIGPAGENLVRFACIENNYWRSAGRTGLGAVMGSKNLKGVVFWGSTRAKLADSEGLKSWVKSFTGRIKDYPAVQAYRKYGTTQLVAIMNRVGGFPSGYWEEGRLEGWEAISGDALVNNFDVRPHACPPCLMACGKMTRVTSGNRSGLQVEGPEYETIYSFGGLCGVKSLEDILYLNDVCDRLGMDTMSAGNILSFAMYAARKGGLDLNLTPGDAEGLAGLLGLIARREGIGGLMAEGIKEFSRAIGMADEAIHVKGLEPAGYDPRLLKGMGLAYATSARGACHLRATFYKPELSGMIDPQTTEGKAELFVAYEDRLAVYDALILCRFYRDLVLWPEIAELLELTTGIRYSEPDLRDLASGIITETRRFNLREGLTRADDTLPRRLIQEPLGTEGLTITQAELDRMLDEYYALRGWNQRGEPS